MAMDNDLNPQSPTQPPPAAETRQRAVKIFGVGTAGGTMLELPGDG